MIHVKNYFMYSPGGENENGNLASNSNEERKDAVGATPENKEKPKERKSFLEKIKEALQDWSNSDQRDLEYDDTKV